MNKTPAIIIDIDGTIALRGERLPHDFDNVDQDLPNQKLIEVIFALKQLKPELDLIFVSGRMESCRPKTVEWLSKYCSIILGSLLIKLYMRENDDFRDDRDVKLELYQKMIEPTYDVYLVFDDRNRVVEMWRSVGLTCFQVADGDF